MTRTTVVAALGAIALGAGFAEAQEPPALQAPLEAPAEPTSGSPPDPPPAERPRPAEPPSRPLLVIPGVTAPPSRRTAQKPTAEAPTAPPALDAPVAEPDVHLRLESIPDGPNPPDAPRPRSAKVGPGREPASAPKGAEDDRGQGPVKPGQHRQPSTFGRLLGPAATPADGKDALSIESSGDPAVEAAVKRRVEKQIREALGDRVKDVDVRVSGRSVSIHARATRVWYRWSARRAIEALSMPPGYRGKAVVD